MINNKLSEEYILSHIDEEPTLLKEINRDANINLLHPNMLSGHLQGRILKMIVSMISPKNVIELGTYTGYSAICIAEALKDGGHLYTVEINDEMEYFANKYITKSEYKDKISLIIGDALDIIPTFDDNFFDLVFIDANKRHYCNYYNSIFPKIKKDGFIIADNTLWYGKILENKNINDNQTKGIVEFNNYIYNDNRVEKVILPIRDGLTLIRKK